MGSLSFKGMTLMGEIQISPNDSLSTYKVSQIQREIGIATSDVFSYGIASSGTTLAIGAYGRVVNSNSAAGTVYMYHYDGFTWSKTHTITAPTPTASARFGYTVAMSGEWLAVSAYNTSSNGTIYLYKFDGTNWNYQQTITRILSGTGFGYSMSMDNDTLAIGHVSGNTYGAAEVYRLSGSTWSHEGTITIPSGFVSRGGTSSQCFGASVCVRGDNIVVGGPGTIVLSGTGIGMVLVASRSGTTWSSAVSLSPSGTSNDLFGNSVVIKNNQLIVGAPGSGTSTSAIPGAVHIYNGSGTSYTANTVLTVASSGTSANVIDPSYTAQSRLGSSVDILNSGTAVIAGAWNNTSAIGCAYVFEKVGTTWKASAIDNNVSRLDPSPTSNNGRFGWRTLFTNGGLIVGAPGSPGAIYWFK